MSYIVFTRDGELPVAADECEIEGGFLVFYAVEKKQMVAQRTISAGLFRRARVKEETTVVKSRDWIMHIRADYVDILISAERASAIEAPSGVETGNTDSTEGESAVPERQTPNDKGASQEAAK